MATNMYLEGNYGPVTEEVEATDLKVTGKIPKFLEGRYLRNGPNPLSADPETYNWFGGDAMVHGIRLRDGNAEWYRNRVVRVGNAAEVLGAPDPGGPITEGMEGIAPNTNVIGINGRTFAIVEAGAKPVEISYDLETMTRADFGGGELGGLPNGYTAHPKVDPVSGERHASSYFWGNPNKLEYTVVDADAALTRYVSVDIPGNPMIHDMSITETRAVFYDLACVFDMERAMSDQFPYAWDDSYGCRLGVISRIPGEDDVRWYDIPNCYVFHPMNAYDDGDRIVLDVVKHPKVFASHFDGPDEGPPHLWRWTIDPASGTVKEEQLSDVPVEFPRVDERLVGRPYRYGWVSGLTPPNSAGICDMGSTIRQFDAKTNDFASHDFGDGFATGEAVFVPTTPEADETDGVVLSIVYDENTDRSQFVVLDAANIESDPLATVELPQRVPFGFHGNWIAD